MHPIVYHRMGPKGQAPLTAVGWLAACSRVPPLTLSRSLSDSLLATPNP